VAELRLGDLGAGVIRVARAWNWKDRKVIPATKTGIPRYVPFSRFLAPLLEASARFCKDVLGHTQGPEDLLAPWYHRGQTSRWNDRTANRRWRDDQILMGWERLPTGRPSIKATRHSFTTLARQAGADLAAVHMITHASEFDSRTSASVYTHLDLTDAAKAIERFDGLIASQMEPQA
jgi:integrase